MTTGRFEIGHLFEKRVKNLRVKNQDRIKVLLII